MLKTKAKKPFFSLAAAGYYIQQWVQLGEYKLLLAVVFSPLTFLDKSQEEPAGDMDRLMYIRCGVFVANKDALRQFALAQLIGAVVHVVLKAGHLP